MPDKLIPTVSVEALAPIAILYPIPAINGKGYKR
jgi:hypothetical protein